MAVFTHLTQEDIAQHIAQYDIGELTESRGIQEGVSNSNFLIQTTQGQYILTLFEHRTDEADIPYFIDVMTHMSTQGIDCPKPIADKAGGVINKLKNRSAVIVSFLAGQSTENITTDHVEQLGKTIAKMHIASTDFGLKRDNSMSFEMWDALAEKIIPKASTLQRGLDELITIELAYLKSHWPEGLVQGTIHADLFPDNVFFQQNSSDAVELSGVIDFYFTCTDFLAYDLAIAMNAWCFNTKHELNKELAEALFSTYKKARPLNQDEKDAFPILARGAAMRFLLTRSHDTLYPVEGADIKAKDPAEYIQKLKFHQQVKSSSEYGV